MSSSPAPVPAPREHVERIRRERYFIGRGEQNPLAEDMHHAVNYLSQELYSKDVHFLMELVQNAEDNEYPSGVAPSLEFLITSKDITGSGIGFKSVFLISSEPHIFSNGYQIKFNEKPCAECNIGYIVPEWVESTPSLSDIKAIYGCSRVLPTTTIILPLKSEKVDAVKKQLSTMHPEMLLFLSKIRKLSVREDNSDPKSSTVSEISISSEKNYQARKNIHAESYTLHLSAEESGKEEECGYYMWRQKFPVKPENRVDKRSEIDEWVIILAFPHGQRLSRGNQLSPGVYAFLPTEMVTNFPFIIQADFLLASSREAILFDSPWNKGILECVPSAFMNAFVTLVKSGADAPAMSLPSLFNFLPVNASLIPLLEPVRSGIKNKVLAEDIVPCESYASQKIFCKPSEVARLKPAFWTILGKAREYGMDLKNLSTHGTYIISSHFDKRKDIHGYKDELKELGVTVEVKFGARFVIAGLSIPEDPSVLSKSTILLLLECIRNYFTSTTASPKGFKEKICKEWLKTSMGYKCPDECILFDAKNSSLCMEDGPFIDETFYGPEIASFKDALVRIGVIVDVTRGEDLIARYLRCQKDSTTISRIYMYLMKRNWKPENSTDNWIWIPNETEGGEWVGLLHIIFAYLADPALDIPTEERHRIVSCLLNVTVQVTDEPITVSYSVSLSTGEVVDVKASRMLRWERENSKLYMQSSHGEFCYKEKIEFATYFAEEISQGLLFEMADQIPSLAELIKVGSLLDFQDTAVEFLLKSKNLLLFPEDEDFLKSSMQGGSMNQ
nr:unnamed protein product [Digitaria exilis]